MVRWQLQVSPQSGWTRSRVWTLDSVHAGSYLDSACMWWQISHSVVPDSCDPMDSILLGSSVHGILQARTPEWVLPFPFPRDLPNPGIEPGSSALQADSLPTEPPAKPAWISAIYSTSLNFTLPICVGRIMTYLIVIVRVAWDDTQH